MKSFIKKPSNECLAMTALFFLLCLATFGLMMFPHNSPDTFAYILDNSRGAYLVCGRAAAYLVSALFIGMDPFKMSWVTALMSMIFLTASAVIIYSKISEAIGKKSLIAAEATAILFCNPSMVDIFHFTSSCYTMTLGVLFAALALIPIKQNISLKNFLISMVLLFVSLNFYQAVLGYYVAMSLLLVYFYNDGRLTWGGGKEFS